MAPVDVAEPKAGEDVLAVAARERAGRTKANRIITSAAAWYAEVRAAYGGEGDQ